MKAIDLFSGFGGFTEGARQAGVEVVYAANHWQTAVSVHASNYPGAVHECQDLRQADWTKIPRFDILLAAPACQGNSRCSQPKRRAYHDALRATAWAVVDCADVTEPKAIVVENVPDIRKWRLYPDWRAALERIGYRLTERIVMATDHGVPQLRERLFIFGLLNGKEPAPLPQWGHWPAFRPHLQAGGDWRSTKLASPGARRRIEAGKRLGKRYLVQHVTGHRGISLDEPIRTITTKDQWAVVNGDRYRPLTLREYARGMGFPESYKWPAVLPRSTVTLGLGNAVCPPVGRDVTRAVAEAV